MYKPVNKKGILIFEILLALAIGSFFILLISDMSLGANKLFLSAVEKDKQLDIFYEKKDLFTDFEIGHTYNVDEVYMSVKRFGNQMVEKFFSVTGALTTTTLISVTNNNSIRDGGYSTFCSPYFAKNRVVGSYEYLFLKGGDYFPEDISDDGVIVTPISLPLSGSNTVTDMVVRHNLLYISTDSTVASDPDIFIFNISNPDNVLLLTSLNTGPGLSSLDVIDDVIYAAAASTQSQMHIIAVHTPTAVSLISKYTLPPPYATATLPFASSIKMFGQYALLGTEKWGGSEFIVVDMSSVTDPQIVYEYEVGSKVRDIEVNGNSVYVSTSAQEQLLLFAFSNSESETDGLPYFVDSFSPSGWTRQEGNRVDVFEDMTLFGRTSGGFDIAKDHELFSWALDVGGFGSVDHSLNIKGGVYGILADKDFVYIGTREYGRELQLYDRTLSATTSLSISLPLGVQDMTCYLGSLYILGNGSPTIYKVNFN